MILSLIQTKGGTGKTTAALCLAYSAVFKSNFNSIAIIELDPQGTLRDWISDREKNGRVTDGEPTIYHLAGLKDVDLAIEVHKISHENDLVIFDVPGESIGRFATKFAVEYSDICLFPTRTSTFDEQCFRKNVYPMLAAKMRYKKNHKKFHILPTFIHPCSKKETILGYFNQILPDHIHCLPSLIPFRSVFENFSRDGKTLHDYINEIQSLKRQCVAANKAICDIEFVADSIVGVIKVISYEPPK